MFMPEEMYLLASREMDKHPDLQAKIEKIKSQQQTLTPSIYIRIIGFISRDTASNENDFAVTEN